MDIGEQKKVQIDTEKFKETLEKIPNQDGYYIFDENVLKFITDQFNLAGLDTEFGYEDTDYFINVMGMKIWISILPYPDDPDKTLMKTVMNLSDEIGCNPNYKSWYSYKNNEHFFNLEKIEPRVVPEEEEEAEFEE
jgi:uncharacterized protein YbcC (UPF0753/DUF2309 family)